METNTSSGVSDFRAEAVSLNSPPYTSSFAWQSFKINFSQNLVIILIKTVRTLFSNRPECSKLSRE
jgi:hypothetical protein